MTNEEAIEFLKNIKCNEACSAIGKDGFYAKLISYHIEALDMAIKALKENEDIKEAYRIMREGL